MNTSTALLVSLMSLAAASSERAAAEVVELPALGATGDVTVSGLSSGAYMATQYHVAHAATVSGAGLIAGGPWGCARGSLSRALGACASGTGIDVGALEQQARELASAGDVDPTGELEGDRVYLFHGRADQTVAREVVVAAADWYYGIVDEGDVHFEDSIGAAHGLPTVEAGAPCGQFGSPFINACDYDLAGEMLGHFYGELEAPVAADGTLLEFRQQAPESAGLAETGFVYVPTACGNERRCRVHVFFHGCGQSVSQIGTALVEKGGFNGWAEANDLIVLYPQVRPSRLAPQNPLACWDWWGYTGKDYLSRDAAQIAAVTAILERLANP